MAVVKVFKGIDELLHSDGLIRKSGRCPEDRDIKIIKKAALLVYRGEILWVGKEADLKLKSRLKSWLALLGEQPKVEELKVAPGQVVPGFVECHTHSVFAGSRAQEFEMRNRGVSYQEIAKSGGGILSTMKATRKATFAELQELYKERVQRFLSQGVTTLEVKSGYALDLKNEKKMLEVVNSEKRIRILKTYLGAHAVPKGKSKSQYLKEVVDKTLPHLVSEGLVDRCDIFVEKGYFTVEDAERLMQACRRYNLRMTIHADQLTRTGISAVAGLDWGIDSVDHAVQINKTDVKKLAKSDVTSVLLPGADFYLQMKYPPARALIDGGARVALATDFNPGSCPTQNLTFVGLLARLKMKMTSVEVFSAYTVGAAHALGLGHKVGALVPGFSCDFAVLDQDWKELFYDNFPMPVKQVYFKGRRVQF